MARPITLELPTRDPRAELQSRLQSAPAEHAEALLAALEVLQGLHDRGVLDLMRGALGSSDEVLEIAVDVAKSPESIRSIRNMLLAVNLLSSSSFLFPPLSSRCQSRKQGLPERPRAF
jgi:hypothetical protein